MNFLMTHIHRSLTDRRPLRGLCVGLIAFVVTAGCEARAQSAVLSVPNAMQGFSQNRDQPIQIEAASLVMRDKEKQATFTGDVKVVQGDTTMKSRILVVFYDRASSASSAPSKPPATAAPIKSATPGPGLFASSGQGCASSVPAPATPGVPPGSKSQ
jgi:lipopolysaccharide export system protein LptA